MNTNNIREWNYSNNSNNTNYSLLPVRYPHLTLGVELVAGVEGVRVEAPYWGALWSTLPQGAHIHSQPAALLLPLPFYF